MPRIKFNYYRSAFKWSVGKIARQCTDCGIPSFNRVCVMEDFTVVGTMSFCDNCKFNFKVEYPPRSCATKKIHRADNKSVNRFPSQYRGITVKEQPKFTKPEAIALHRQAMKLNKEYKNKKGRLDNSALYSKLEEYQGRSEYRAKLIEIAPIKEQACELERQARVAESTPVL